MGKKTREKRRQSSTPVMRGASRCVGEVGGGEEEEDEVITTFFRSPRPRKRGGGRDKIYMYNH